MAAISFKNSRMAWLILLSLISLALLYLYTPRSAINALSPHSQTTTSSPIDSLSKNAFVTLLAAETTSANGDKEDKFFTSIRMQAYALLHAPETRSDIPFIVLAGKDTVPEWKKERLRADGAIVLEIDHTPLPSWYPEITTAAWVTIFDKLVLWKELTQYERICFMDGDVVIMQRLDDIFKHSPLQQTKVANANTTDHLDTLPDEYVLQATLELTVDHSFPPVQADFERGDYLNAGFLLLRPSTQVYEHYMAILNTPYSFPTEFAEQNLLNHVHRPDGPMPFAHLDWQYNVHRPTLGDIEAGVKTVHSKWWNVHHHEIYPHLEKMRWKMDGYFEFRDTQLGLGKSFG